MKILNIFLVFASIGISLFIFVGCSKNHSDANKPQHDTLELIINDGNKSIIAKQEISAGTYIYSPEGKIITLRDKLLLLKNSTDFEIYNFPTACKDILNNLYVAETGKPFLSYLKKTENGSIPNTQTIIFCEKPYIRLYAVEKIRKGEKIENSDFLSEKSVPVISEQKPNTIPSITESKE